MFGPEAVVLNRCTGLLGLTTSIHCPRPQASAEQKGSEGIDSGEQGHFSDSDSELCETTRQLVGTQCSSSAMPLARHVEVGENLNRWLKVSLHERGVRETRLTYSSLLEGEEE